MNIIWIFRFSQQQLYSYIHGPNGNFGFGEHSTGYIEVVQGNLKSYIKRIYNIIPDINFVLFLREAELRYIFKNLNNKQIEDKIKEIMEHLYNIVDFELYELDELEENNNYDF